jgi:uncharacterized membrane protein YccF (DUF307 family)
VIAWILNLTIIGFPLGMWMLSRLPQVMTLRSEPFNLEVVRKNGETYVLQENSTPFLLRVIYFLLVGWWFSFIWLQVAWWLAASVIGIPLGFMMFERTNQITTLGK